MAETRTVTVRLRFPDLGPFQRAMHDAAQSGRAFRAAFQGQPHPPRQPYRRSYSAMTARQYRAARRRYGRELRAWRKAHRG